MNMGSIDALPRLQSLLGQKIITGAAFVWPIHRQRSESLMSSMNQTMTSDNVSWASANIYRVKLDGNSLSILESVIARFVELRRWTKNEMAHAYSGTVGGVEFFSSGIHRALQVITLAKTYKGEDGSYYDKPLCIVGKTLRVRGKLAGIFDQLPIYLQLFAGVAVGLLSCFIFGIGLWLFDKRRPFVGTGFALLGFLLFLCDGFVVTGFL